MKWKILAKGNKDIVKTLLANRGFKTKEEIEEFLNPPDPLTYSPTDLSINPAQLKSAIARIKQAIKNKEPIVVYGDYDADGICASAIMWETLHDLGAQAMPFIPLREKEGYGLSKEGIDTILEDGKYSLNKQSKSKIQASGLIITVDSGIVAHEAVDYAKTLGLDIVVIDHHEKPKKLPRALALVQTEKLCASGIALFVSSILKKNDSFKESFFSNHLELAAIATVTDLMPLTGANRSIVRHGIEALNRTTRPGLKTLFRVVGLEKIGTYEIGFMIGPRLNASGRIENALTALRLLCAKNQEQARELANLLNETNRSRQTMLEEMAMHAHANYELRIKNYGKEEKIIVIEDESYHQGVIGLVAGKLVEKYYLPAIVIAKGETVSKASARSIAGFNIIEAIRSTDRLLLNAGGHPMAAGFTIETSQIKNFKLQIENLARDKITPEMLERTLKIDCELKIEEINMGLYHDLARFAPFGIGNPEPVFASKVVVKNLRTVGQDSKHLKLSVSPLKKNDSLKESFFKLYDAIGFGMGSLASKVKIGDQIRIAYSLALDTYNGDHKLQLKIKDINYG